MFSCPAVNDDVAKEATRPNLDVNASPTEQEGGNSAAPGYADVLSQHLQSLQAALLQQHSSDLEKLRDQNAQLRHELTLMKAKLLDVTCVDESAPKAAGSGVPVLQVPVLPEQTEASDAEADSEAKPANCDCVCRWERFTARLLDTALSANPWQFTASQPAARTTRHVLDELKMRAAWSISLVEAKDTYVRSLKYITSLRESTSMRITDAFTDTSFLQRFVVGPPSKQQLVWAMIASVFIIWDLITIPLEMFQVEEFIRVLDIVGIVSLTFWLTDMPLHLIFGVQLRGSMELRPKVLWKLYFRSWFAVDLLIVLLDVTVILMEALSNSPGGNAFRSARFLRSLRLLRLFRLVRVAKLQRELSLVASRFLSTYAFMVMKIVGALLMMLAINHIIGCCWYGIGTGIDGDRTWLHRTGIQDAGFAESYVYSIHWALTQFTPATNNIAPDNALERFFAIWVILLAMGVYSSFIGSISSTVNSLRAVRGEKIKQQSRLLQFFIERNLSLELYGNIQETLRREGMVEVRLKESEVHLISGLPERFKQQLHEELFLCSVQRLPFWPSWIPGASDESFFFSNLCHQAISECVATPGEDAFMPGTVCEHAYVVESGFMNYTEGSSGVQEVSRGAILCLACLWSEWQHAGRLAANSGTSYYMTIESDQFCSIATRFGGQVFGILMVGAVEHMQEEGVVADLCFDSNRIAELASRAERFHHLFDSLDNSALQETSFQARLAMAASPKSTVSDLAAAAPELPSVRIAAVSSWI